MPFFIAQFRKIDMKLFIIMLPIVLSSCSALSNPQGSLQSARLIDLKSHTYKVTCSGAVEDWSNCYDRATKTCTNGYELKERNESPVGGKRELVFQCK